MDDPNTNHLYVGLFFVLRCLLPLMLMLGISYILKKFGLIKDTPQRPSAENNPSDGDGDNGGLAHV